MGDVSNEVDRTLFCGNLEERITEDLLFELFLQSGPLERVKIPMDNNSGKKKNFGFVTFKHVVSVPYAIKLMNGIQMFGKPLRLQAREGSVHQQNRQYGNNFNRSQSAPHGQEMNSKNYGFQPPQMQRGQTYGGQYQPMTPSPLMAGSDNGHHNDGRNRSRYDERDPKRRENYDDRRDRGRYDNERRDSNDRSRTYERDRSHDRNRNSDHNRDRSGGYHQNSDRHNSSRGSSSFETPPRPTRFDQTQNNRHSGNNQLPMMNPVPQQDIQQIRQNVMALQQRQMQFYQLQMQYANNNAQQQGYGQNRFHNRR